MKDDQNDKFNAAAGTGIDNDPPLIIEDLHVPEKHCAAPRIVFAEAAGDAERLFLAIEAADTAEKEGKAGMKKDDAALARILGASAS